MTGEIDVWTPVVHRVQVGDRLVEIGPLKAKDFSRVQVMFPPVLAMISADHLHELYSTGHDSLVALLAVTCQVDADWLNEQYTDTLLRLLALSVETNRDFSMRRVAPALQEMVDRVQRAAEGTTGESSSPDAGSSDTGETTSST